MYSYYYTTNRRRIQGCFGSFSELFPEFTRVYTYPRAYAALYERRCPVTNPHPPAAHRSLLLISLAGLAAGLLNGLLGAAGGILLVAILPRLTPPSTCAPQHPPDRRDTLATALSVMLPVSAVSGLFYWLGGIRPSPALLLALVLPAAAGGLLGAKILARIPAHLLRKIFAAVVVIAGIRMLLG